MRVLGIDVAPELVQQWVGWLAPACQPFFVESADEWPTTIRDAPPLTPELRDTYKVWRMPHPGEVVWLDEAGFQALPRPERGRLVREQVDRRRGAVPTVARWRGILDADALQRQADGHRFVWWPSLVGPEVERVLAAVIEDGRRGSRHDEVPAAVWAAARGKLLGARSLAGTFAQGSGPNCFGTVMAAAGVSRAESDWVQEQRFLAWLDECCVPGGHDYDVGTVLVWRNSDGLPVHAAVALGRGWALEKPAQTWWTPRLVLTVDQVKRDGRTPGHRMERHNLRCG